MFCNRIDVLPPSSTSSKATVRHENMSGLPLILIYMYTDQEVVSVCSSGDFKARGSLFFSSLEQSTEAITTF